MSIGKVIKKYEMKEQPNDFSLGLKPDDFLESDQMVQLGYPPNCIDIENIKKNKMATGRPQHLADAENLE
jgi:hypothetical protein